MDFGGNFVFINQEHKVKNLKLLWNIKVFEISIRSFVARNFPGGAIGD